jgi:predicted RNase H-like HicB family nuclease
MDRLKIIIERHSDGFVSYPLGLKGVVVGQGNTYDEALENVRSAIDFHIDTFGREAFENESPVLEAFIAETQLAA